MDVSCALPTSLESPLHAAEAEDLGYEHAWFYDNPPFSPDVWMMLALAAQATSRIGLGPGVLVPGLRHPMVNAAGTAGLVALAPGRVKVAFGTGFAMRVLGQPEISWSYLAAYVTAFRGLLGGEPVEWEGASIQMLHPEGHAPPRPIEVPVLIAALGPKGDAVARRVGDGLFVVGPVVPAFAREYSRVAALRHGTVLGPEDDIRSDRVRASAGPGTMLPYHYGFASGADVASLPGGEAWTEVVDRHPVPERRLVAHQQHFVGLNDADRAAWDAGAWRLVTHVTLTGDPARVRASVEHMADQGVTEVVYQPAGADIRRELATFMGAVRG